MPIAGGGVNIVPVGGGGGGGGAAAGAASAIGAVLPPPIPPNPDIPMEASVPDVDSGGGAVGAL